MKTEQEIEKKLKTLIYLDIELSMSAYISKNDTAATTPYHLGYIRALKWVLEETHKEWEYRDWETYAIIL